MDGQGAPRWRPISTAPRDGTPVLVRCGEADQNPRVAVFVEDTWMDPDGTHVLNAETTGLPTHWAPVLTDDDELRAVPWRSRQFLWLLVALVVIALVLILFGAELENSLDLLP
jgi:hypothetical protein